MNESPTPTEWEFIHLLGKDGSPPSVAFILNPLVKERMNPHSYGVGIYSFKTFLRVSNKHLRCGLYSL